MKDPHVPSSVTIDEIAGRVAKCFSVFVGEAEIDWPREVRAVLVLSSVPYSKALNNVARPALQRFVASFDAPGREEHLRVMGKVARFAVVAEYLHQHQGGRRRGASTSQRAASSAFLAVESARSEGARPFDPIDSVVLWILASLVIGADESAALARRGLDRTYQRGFAASNRWVSSFRSDRQRDIDCLTGGDARLRGFLSRLIEAGRTQLDPRVVIELAASEREADCWCSDPRSFVEQVWRAWPFAEWQRFPVDPAEAEYLADLKRAALPRSDLLVIGADIVVLNGPALLDALLVVCASRAGDAVNSAWHEREVSRAVFDSLSPIGTVAANVLWATEDSLRTAAESGDRHHDGEIDVLIINEAFVVDVQAKSARSLDHEQRERVPVIEARRQHERLAATGGKPLMLFSAPAGTGTERRIRLGPEGLGHLPITVGTEVIQAWAVGGGGDGGPHRVLTTLDHMRIVNRFVPAMFRPAYWIDRYAQELGPLRFIDEMDFLGKWSALLWGEGGSWASEAFGDLVAASASLIEDVVAWDNTVLDQPEHHPGPERTGGDERVAHLDPARRQPRVYRLLSRVISASVHEGLALSRLLVDHRVRIKLETALANGRSIILTNEMGELGLVYGKAAAEVMKVNHLDTAIFLDPAGLPTVLETVPLHTQIRMKNVTPRWRLPQQP